MQKEGLLSKSIQKDGANINTHEVVQTLRNHCGLDLSEKASGGGGLKLDGYEGRGFGSAEKTREVIL
jgi:hypothetical protein